MINNYLRKQEKISHKEALKELKVWKNVGAIKEVAAKLVWHSQFYWMHKMGKSIPLQVN